MQSTVVAVPNSKQLDELIHAIRRKYQIKAIEDHSYRVVQDRIHRVQVWKDGKLDIQVTVVVVPVVVNTDKLMGYGAGTKIHVDFIKQELLRQIKRVEDLSINYVTDTDLKDKLVGEI
jgi:hypothetical protein